MTPNHNKRRLGTGVYSILNEPLIALECKVTSSDQHGLESIREQITQKGKITTVLFGLRSNKNKKVKLFPAANAKKCGNNDGEVRDAANPIAPITFLIHCVQTQDNVPSQDVIIFSEILINQSDPRQLTLQAFEDPPPFACVRLRRGELCMGFEATASP